MTGEEKEKFLSRWSRRKQEANERPAAEPPAAPAVDPKAPPPELPPVDKLTMDSDFSGFFHPKVDEAVRRTALKKLFANSHFNVMDGLDVYIDDYSKPNPMPAAMLAGLKQAQNILEWARERKGEEAQEKTGGQEPDQPQLTAQEAPPPAEQAPPVSEPARTAHLDAGTADDAAPPEEKA